MKAIYQLEIKKKKNEPNSNNKKKEKSKQRKQEEQRNDDDDKITHWSCSAWVAAVKSCGSRRRSASEREESQ